MQRRMAALAFAALAVLVLAGLYVGFQLTAQRPADPRPTDPARGAAAPSVNPGPSIADRPDTREADPVRAAPSEPPLEVSEGRAAPPASPAVPSSDSLRIAIDKAKPGEVLPVLLARQGDALTILITTNRAGMLEIHGYGQSIGIAPGAEAKLAFRARHAGRFPIHLHARDGAHLELTALEVRPR